jgi:nicotinamidase-related amidase
VVFTKFINMPGSPYERLIGWTKLRESPETDLCAEVQIHASFVIEKHFYSAFTPELRDLTREHGWDIVCVCGFDTDSCVLKTAVDAFELGYTPYVLADACGTHSGVDLHDAALRMLRRFIGKGQVVESEDFFANLNSLANQAQELSCQKPT